MRNRKKKKKASKKRANGVFVWPKSLSLGGPSRGNKSTVSIQPTSHTLTHQHFFHTVIICNCLHARDFIDNEFPGH